MKEALPVIIPAVTLLLGGLITYWGTRGKTQADAKAALDSRIDQRVADQLQKAWARITSLEGAVESLELSEKRRAAATARVLRRIAQQWTGDTSPDLDPADMALIEDTIPPAWFRTPPASKET